jgi:hypothetical protein
LSLYLLHIAYTTTLFPYLFSIPNLTYLSIYLPTYLSTLDINFVRLFGGLVEGALEATWDVTGPNTWKVIFQNITFRILGLPVVDKKPLGGR